MANTMDHSNSCRLCLSKEGRHLPIFGSATDGMEPLGVRIQSYLSIEVSQYDSLPKQICHRCECQVNVWHYFKAECEVSQQKLRSWLRTVSSPSEKVNGVEEHGRGQEGVSHSQDVRIKLEPEDLDFNEEHHINSMEFESIQIPAYPASSDDTVLASYQGIDNEEDIEQINEGLAESNNDLNLVISGTKSVDGLGNLFEEADSAMDGGPSSNTRITSMEGGNTDDARGQPPFLMEVSPNVSDNNISQAPTTAFINDTSASSNVCHRTENPSEYLKEEFIGSSLASLTIKKERLDFETDSKVESHHAPSSLKTEQPSSRRRSVKSVRVRSVSKQSMSSSSKQSEDSSGYNWFNLASIDLPKIINEVYDESTMTCKVCNKTYPRSNLWRHVKTYHADKNPFRCAVCRKDFPGRREFVAHRIRTVSKYCREGKRPEAVLTIAVNSKVKRGNPGKYECRECKLKFCQLSSAKSHVRLHTGEKPFFCYMCNEREFRLRKTAIKHASICAGKRDNQALISKAKVKLLPRILPVPIAMKRKVTKRPNSDKTHKCRKCGKVFTSGIGMSNHLRTECKKKCFSCLKFVSGNTFYKHFRQCFKSKHSFSADSIGNVPINCVKLQSSQNSTAENEKQSTVSEKIISDSTKQNITVVEKKNPRRLCKVDISLKDLWAKHLDVDGKLKSFKCQLCEKTMSGRKSLHAHLLKHSAKAYKCEVCNCIFSSRIRWDAHMLSVHKKDHDHCKSDAALQSSGEGASSLLKARLTGKFAGFKLSKLKCDICLKIFSSASSLRYHKLNHKKVKCEKCEITFPSTMEKTHVCTPKVKMESSNPEQGQGSQENQSTVLPEKRAIQYTCLLCQKKFHTRKMLYQHKKMHIKMKIYKCKMCGNSYSDTGALQQHKELAHADELALIAANEQNAHGTNIESSVKAEHQSVDSEDVKTVVTHAEKPWKCDVCHRGYSHKESLLRHMRLHRARRKANLPSTEKIIGLRKPSNPDLIYCSHCDKAFTTEKGFNRHKGWHFRMESIAVSSVKSEIPAATEDADVSDTNSTEVSSSVNFATPQAATFTCNICPRIFSSQKSLKMHKAKYIHHNPKTSKEVKKETVSPTESQHVCEICLKSFPDASALSAHMSSHGGSTADAAVAAVDIPAEGPKQETLQCNLCNKEYRCKKSLKYHMMGHSGEKPYKCRSCSNQYSNPKALTKHEKERHTIVTRPFCCHRCKTSFILKEELLAHHAKCTH